MSSRKQSRITNIWSKVIKDGSGNICTKVVVEATSAFEYRVSRRGNDVILKAAGVAANMPEGTIEVNDGLVRKVSLIQTSAGEAVFEIHPEHPCEYRVEAAEGIPFRTAIILNWAFLIKMFKGKKLVIDPGHGGDDWGGKGPVSLIEKNVVLLIARAVEDLFGQVGIQTVATRAADENISADSRFELAKNEKADLFIGIHTYSDNNSKVGGAAVRYKPSCKDSLLVAGMIKEELIQKLKVADRGLKESRELAVPGEIPGVEVEVVTITNWVEEGLLRSPTIHKKAAEGIFNGVRKYFANIGGH
ncbi:MAG: N-acetylmuramoyl-L-alanine amidase LytC precursor [Pelotomaculum sp. PtaU1.Bin035]|nr:MAG: N-acetylmuramoyl-L-alanine amidase LytC precursor [Pelotomaculum sp. PtaU1.Bin035]